ncbi:cytochrome P450 [Streptomyces sp. NPDC020681]|uniref:cytochrome P450 n=1 Tax=Streptomyces sp. NPDC020681 TaxID=3365083 RepID=UPI0037B5CEA1
MPPQPKRSSDKPLPAAPGKLLTAWLTGDDPHAVYRELRAIGEIVTYPGGLFALSHRTCRVLLTDSRWEPVPRSAGPESLGLQRLGRTMLFRSGAEHRTARRTHGAAVSNRGLTDLRPLVERRVDEAVRRLLDALNAAGEGASVDAVALVSDPLPVEIICDVLGLPQDGRGELARHAEHSFRVQEFTASPEDLAVANRSMLEVARYISENDPSLGIDAIDNRTLMLAGGATTTSALLGAVLHYAASGAVLPPAGPPGDEARVRLVDELLRYDPPAHMFTRRAAEDTELGGFPMAAGTLVHGVVASAARDPELLDDGDAFRPDRTPVPHLAFGAGPHFCPGSRLARMEAEVLLDRLARDVPAFVSAGAPRRPDWARLIRHFAHLPVRLAHVMRDSAPAQGEAPPGARRFAHVGGGGAV